MKHNWTKRLGAVVLSVAMLGNTGMIFAETLTDKIAEQDAIEDKVLFSTSFEDDENGNLLQSTLDGDHLSNVVNTEYLSQGGGLAIRYETIEGSSDYVGSESKYNLFDDKTSTKYLSQGSNIYVAFALEKAAVVRSYDVASANDAPGRDPSAWTLYGSDDGKTWKALDSREGVTFNSRMETKKFGFENKTSYQWYKFEITANKGDSLTQLSTLHLFSDNAEVGDGVDDGSVKVLPDSIKGMAELGYNASQNKAALFDGSLASKFISADPTGWISVQLSAPIVLAEYKIGSGDDWPQRDPKSWIVYGSTDGENWVKLDEQNDVSMPNRNKLYSFPVENTVAYDYYKIDITANGGEDGTGRNIIQFSEWQFVEASSGEEDKEEYVETQLTVDTTTVQGSASNDGDQGNLQLFDNSVDTKLCVANVTSLWVSVKLSAPAAVNMYKIASANDHDPRDPKDWVLYGSNDGENWVKLDERSNQDMPERNTYYTYTFENDTEYSYYKLDILSNNGKDAVGLDVVQFSEWQLFTVQGVSDAPVETQMSVDTTTVQGSASNDGDQGNLQLFDNNVDTKLCVANVTSLWVSVKLSAPAAVNMYKIASANDHDPRDPKDWVLYGSNDGENWVKLDERSNQDMPERNTYYTYTFENDTEYSYYKLDVLSNNGKDAVGLDVVQFSEWQLFTVEGAKVEEPEDVQVTVDTTTVQGSASNDGDQGNLQLFDNNVDTKLCVAGVTSLWVSVKLSAPAAVNMYKIASANDHDPRDPKDWVLYGSNDGETWVKLDERSGEDLPERNTYYTYTFYNETEYSYYKLDVLSNNGKDAVGLDVVQFSEWQLFVTSREIEEPEEKEPVPTVNKETVESSAPVDGGEGVINVFDGNVNTKVCAAGKTMWITFALTEAMLIKGYSITSANDHATRNPKDWAFYGSTDGKTWVKLDARSGVEFSDYFETKSFAFANDTEYQYYKLDITANCGNDYTQFSELALLTETEGLVEQKLPGMVTKPVFGPISTECNYPGAWSGLSCLGVYGEQTDTKNTYARNVIFKDLSIPVTKNTKLSYVIFPGLFNVNAYDYEYTSCRVIIDLAFTDGTYLSELGAIDQYGSKMTPTGQVEGECLYTLQWNYIESYIGDVAAGKTIEKILVYFDMPEAKDASRFVTFFDDLVIEDKEPVVYEHLSDYINILRGTNNDIAFSRGMCTPGVVTPGGFNFFTPVTNPQAATLPYTYQQNGENSPLDSISVLHAPNFWIGSYGSFQFMANTSVDTSAGTDGITSAQISSDARKSKFTHQNEFAKAHEYTVILNDGTAASGVMIEVTPTDHAAYVRFTFPEGSDNVNVIFDSLWGSGSLKFGADGKSFTAKTGHGSPAMYVYGEFDTEYASASVVATKQGIVSFPEGTTVVTMKIATSYLSYDQAKHSMELEIADGNYDSVFAAAQKEWDDLCGIFEIEGATYNELVTFYSSLYRLYAFPSLFSENEGTANDPVWVYASPYKSGRKTSGMLYTNNGFWDTYRTAWAAYALFTPERDTDYLNGMVQHFTETGWMPRWLGPGAVNCMVGTSSDIIFADAYLKGVEFNYEEAWKSMVKSSSAYSSDMTAGGRKENNTAPFLGYIANDRIINGESQFVQEAYSSSIEGYINDYGLYRMAEAMGLADEAEYYYNRCMQYALLYNSAVGFFMGKSTAGVWSAGKSFDPKAWNGPMYDFTESVGWVNQFPAVFDGQGFTSLHGGSEKLAKLLNELFDDSYEAMKEVVELASVHHEIAEFKEVKMGQYMHNNQPSHHVIYTYAFSSEPYKVQQYTREVLRHVYVGSELGQGYPGDEDNGEMSGWYVFNALGFYPYSMGSNEYVIGSPLFDKVTIHLENGNDIVIIANNNSDENVYIQSAKMNGENYNKMFLSHEDLVNGCTIEFEMGSEPSTWGSGEDSAPTSLTETGKMPASLADITNTGKLSDAVTSKTNMITAIEGADKLFDNNSLTYTTITGGQSIVLTGTEASKIAMLTLTCNKASEAPAGYMLDVSNDGENWTTLDTRTNLKWEFDNFVKPFAIPEESRGAYMYYRVTLYGGTQLAEVEFIGEKGKIENPDEITGINLDKESVTLAEGSTETLKAIVTPEGANVKLIWTSDNETIVTVDENGNLTAVAPGEATITVSTEDGKFSATCKVTVTEKGSDVTPGDNTMYILAGIFVALVGVAAVVIIKKKDYLK